MDLFSTMVFCFLILCGLVIFVWIPYLIFTRGFRVISRIRAFVRRRQLMKAYQARVVSPKQNQRSSRRG